MIAERESGYCRATRWISSKSSLMQPPGRPRVERSAQAPVPAAPARPDAEIASDVSAIHLPHDGVERADDRDQVGDERVAHAGRGRLQGYEARRAELHAPGSRAAVGDDVTAELTPGRLDRDVDLALRHAVALGDDLEVVDEGLHRGVELLARRQHDLAVVGDPRLALHPLEPAQTLADDPVRLRHLVHVNLVPVPDIAVLVDGHAEVHLIVGEVRLVPAEVP